MTRKMERMTEPSQYDDCGATLATESWSHPDDGMHHCIKQTGHADAGDKKHQCDRTCGEEWITEVEQAHGDRERTAMTDDLIEFIRARLDDDEQTWAPVIRGPRMNGKALARRMLLDIEARRRIIDLHKAEPRPESPSESICWICNDGGRWPIEPSSWPCATLRLLALFYSDHPDYREKWRP